MVKRTTHDKIMSKELKIGEDLEDFKQPVPDCIEFEKEESWNHMSKDRLPVTRKTEEIDFHDFTSDNTDGITYDEVKVSVKRGVSVMWTLIHEDKDLMVTREIPWHRVIDIKYGHEKVVDE